MKPLPSGSVPKTQPDEASAPAHPPRLAGSLPVEDAADLAGDDGKHGADLSPAELDFMLTLGLAL
jgi:hypothetical protein